MPRACAGARERRERSVAAEQGVDALEARHVVAVAAAGREHRPQEQGVRAEPLDVIETLLDPAKIAAEELERRLRALAAWQ